MGVSFLRPNGRRDLDADLLGVHQKVLYIRLPLGTPPKKMTFTTWHGDPWSVWGSKWKRDPPPFVELLGARLVDGRGVFNQRHDPGPPPTLRACLCFDRKLREGV